MSKHAALVESEVARILAIQWFQPDAQMDQAGEPALRFLRERLDEHFGALAQCVPGFVAPPARVELVRSASEAGRRCGAVFGDKDRDDADDSLALVPPRKPAAEAWGQALEKAGALAETWVDRAFDQAIRAALKTALPTWYELPKEHAFQAGWLGRFWNSGAARGHPCEAGVTRHLRWVARFGDRRPSPWAPVLAIFERGAWPVVTYDGALLVYVPVRSGGQWLPEPSDPNVHELPRGTWISWSDPREKDLGYFYQQGCGPIPVVYEHTGTFNPVIPTEWLQAPPGVPPGPPGGGPASGPPGVGPFGMPPFGPGPKGPWTKKE